MNQPYHPISCAVHDVMLDLATRRQPCVLTIEGDDGASSEVSGIIEDVYSREGAEYLRLSDGPTIRLDRIVRLDGRPVPSAD